MSTKGEILEKLSDIECYLQYIQKACDDSDFVYRKAYETELLCDKVIELVLTTPKFSFALYKLKHKLTLFIRVFFPIKHKVKTFDIPSDIQDTI